ncbi:hypothetical protein BQ9231_00373 [Cedratvirus lausannensis]|uniref:Uncharacterized protein n=1 Tax=Cedratvirus lausannensis TaxID=2023205 RepID=A0A285PYJ3_9VIRU|nr:hypothetical protein BQ9231_00373 [Cedratvirus lausannensis]
MSSYYAVYGWREGHFVRMYACQADFNPEKTYYCIVDTVEEMLEFMDTVVSIEKKRKVDTYDQFFKVGVIERMEGSSAIYGKEKYEIYFDRWDKVVDKRGLVMEFISQAKLSRVHRIDEYCRRCIKWSPQPEGFYPKDFTFPEFFTDDDPL